MDVAALCFIAGRRGNHARRGRAVGFGVNQDKSAGAAIFSVKVERDRPQQIQGHHADAVHLQRLGGFVRERADVGAVLDR